MTDAVVVGLCSHGLAVCRALKKAELDVVAIESNRKLPGTRTNAARVHFVNSIAGPGICDTLQQLAESEGFSNSQPWLFLTNDSMVRSVGEGWHALQTCYRISWSGSREKTLELLSKENIGRYCEIAGVDYPRSFLISKEVDCELLDLSFPVVVKPASPMSRFKVVVAGSMDHIRSVITDFPDALPFVVQEWIPGPIENLVFAAGFAVEGKLISIFVGHKVRSWPKDSGQGSVIAPLQEREVQDEAEKFIAATGLTGPIAVEFKRRPDGRLALIEPNVGRTEYCTNAATINGVDLAASEYAYCSTKSFLEMPQVNRGIWCDTERDWASWISALSYLVRRRSFMVIRTPYASAEDPKPFFLSVRIRIRLITKKIVKKALSLIHRSTAP